jgi:hypothetical protein
MHSAQEQGTGVRQGGPRRLPHGGGAPRVSDQSGGGASAHIDYAKLSPSESTAWLANMPSDEEAGWNAAASDDTIRKEVAAASAASGSTLPPPPFPPPPSLPRRRSGPGRQQLEGC